MKISGLIATCFIVLLFTMNINSFLEIQSTDKITTAIQEQDSVSPTNNYYETHNHYENNYYEEPENEKESEQKEDQESTIYQEDNTLSTKQEPWSGPKSYKCNRAAGYPAICGYCGQQGEIHHDIKEWQDTQGTYHLTHIGCGRLYCDSIGIEPKKEESYKVK